MITSSNWLDRRLVGAKEYQAVGASVDVGCCSHCRHAIEGPIEPCEGHTDVRNVGLLQLDQLVVDDAARIRVLGMGSEGGGVDQSVADTVALTRLLIERETLLVTSAGVVAQVWRDGAGRLVPVAYLLQRVDVVALDYRAARVVGRMLGLSRTRKPVDAHIVLLAREREWPVLTSDPDDLQAINPTLVVERV